MRGWNVTPKVCCIWLAGPAPRMNELFTSFRPKVEVIHSGWYALDCAARCSVPNEKKLHMQMTLVTLSFFSCSTAFCAVDGSKSPLTGLMIASLSGTLTPHVCSLDVIGVSADRRATASVSVNGSSRMPNLRFCVLSAFGGVEESLPPA